MSRSGEPLGAARLRLKEEDEKIVCPRCRVELEDADEAEGCEDYHCPYTGGAK